MFDYAEKVIKAVLAVVIIGVFFAGLGLASLIHWIAS